MSTRTRSQKSEVRSQNPEAQIESVPLLCSPHYNVEESSRAAKIYDRWGETPSSLRCLKARHAQEGGSTESRPTVFGCGSAALCASVVSPLAFPAFRAFCKTNANDRGFQNQKTSFFRRKPDISSWRGPVEKHLFYETNPNRENQDARLQLVMKTTDGEKNKTNPNDQIETGKTLQYSQLHLMPEHRNRFPENAAIRHDPTQSG